MEEMQIEMIPMDKIKPNPRNPREEFDEEEIKQLAESIEGSVLMNPISIRRMDSQYEVIAGDRRFFAFQVLEMDEAPSIVREADDFEAELMSAIENWHRKGLDQEEQIYNLWVAGKAKGRYKKPSHLAKETGIRQTTVYHIINKFESDFSLELKERTTYMDFERTVPVKDDSKLRKRILEKRVSRDLKSTDLREFSKLVKKADEEMKETLLKPGVTMKDARKIVTQKEMEEALEEKTAEEEVTEEEKQEWKEKAEKTEEEIEEILEKPETKEKGKLRRNWQDLETVLNRIGEITCPVCGKPAAEHLKFDCHDLTVEEAWKMARDEYQKAIKGGD